MTLVFQQLEYDRPQPGLKLDKSKFHLMIFDREGFSLTANNERQKKQISQVSALEIKEAVRGNQATDWNGKVNINKINENMQ